MIKFLSQLLDFIYKKRCYFCSSSKENSLMCSSCYDEQEFLQEKVLKYIDNVPVYSAMIYKDNIQKLIRGLKYHNQKELAVFQAKLMYDYWKKLEVSKNDFVIVPVPLFVSREKKRKYNQMMLVAQEFSKLTGYKVNNELVKRVKNTKPQYKLSKKERKENLHNAFEYNPHHYNGEKLLIIDDILTTGSTMEEIIKTFQNAKVNDLTIFVTSCTEFNLN